MAILGLSVGDESAIFMLCREQKELWESSQLAQGAQEAGCQAGIEPYFAVLQLLTSPS